VHRFTIGQRKGLGLGTSERLYVCEIDAASNAVIVGAAEDLLAQKAWLEEVHWISGAAPTSPLRAEVQVRHRHEAVAAEIEPAEGRRALLRFESPVRSVTPGQAAVFYQGERVLGGGWIARGANPDDSSSSS
jgi:tRNA-specific 2-thiouridylase